MAAGCESCKLISKQCSDLKFEVALLNKKLNKLIESLSGEKRKGKYFARLIIFIVAYHQAHKLI